MQILRTLIKNLLSRLSAAHNAPDGGQSMPQYSRAAQAAMRAADEEILYGADPERLTQACISAMHALDAEKGINERRKANLVQAFSRNYAVYFRERVMNIVPNVLPEHAARVARYTRGAMAATVLEITLATLAMSAAGMNPVLAFVSSCVLTLLLLYAAHSAITEWTETPSPRQTHDRIKTHVLRPALLLAGPSLGVVIFARLLSDLSEWMLAVLLPVLQLALWGTTLGLILLTGALIALADLYRWSETMARAYDQCEHWQAELDNRRAYYHAHIPRRPQPTGVNNYTFASSSAPQRKPFVGGNGTARTLLLLLLFGSGFLSGCNGAMKQKEARAQGHVATPAPAALHINVDVSGSLATAGGTAAAQHLHAQLPAIVDAIGATILTVTYFAKEGWMVPRTLKHDWSQPVPPASPVKQRSAGEIAFIPAIGASVEKANQQALEAARQEAARRQAEAREQALAAITPALLNPSGITAAPCTDINGTLMRIGMAPKRSLPQVYVILTDGYQSCGPLAAIPAPPDNVRVLILLAPANAREGAGKAPAAQFENRRTALHRAAPWAQIVSAYEPDLAELLRAAQP